VFSAWVYSTTSIAGYEGADTGDGNHDHDAKAAREHAASRDQMSHAKEAR